MEYQYLLKYINQIVGTNLSANDRIQLLELVENLLINLNNGHSCLDLNSYVKENKRSLANILLILENSNLATVFQKTVNNFANLFVILNAHDNYFLFVTRYFYYEISIVKELSKLNVKYNINETSLFNDLQAMLINEYRKNDFPNQNQLNAILNVLIYKISIITGGPGTGKTSTISLILWILMNYYQIDLNIKFCAPTGKAVARLKEALKTNIELLKKKFPTVNYKSMNDLISNDDNYLTIHRMLGFQNNNIYFKFNEINKLKVDILIIDESSMIGLPLFYKLLKALDADVVKHLIFLGDKNQLSSVEEGYVFASIINSSAVSNIITLTQGKRNNINISKVAYAILNNKDAMDLIDGMDNIIFKENKIEKFLIDILNLDAFNQVELFTDNAVTLLPYFDLISSLNIKTHINDKVIEKIFSVYNNTMILSCSNYGSLGVININEKLDRIFISLLKKHNNFEVKDNWYTGRPIIILDNDYSNNLYNGDIGICVIINNEPLIFFEDKRFFVPHLLPEYKLAYALTIHKAQGSEFNNIAILIDDICNRENKKNLLNKEMLYTAITRAKDFVSIYTSRDLFQIAINNSTTRYTGLAQLFRDIK